MKLALQTFTVRKEQKKDIYNTLKKCIDMGFNAFELSRFEYDLKTLDELKRLKKDYNIQILNFQKTFECLSSNFEMVKRFCMELDCNTACISVLPLKYILGNKEKISEFIKEANELFDRFKKEGILLTYHTHDFEYINVNGFKAIDLIKDKIKTPLVVDAYWATRAGIHVPSLLNELKNKVYAIHLKDYNSTFSYTKRGTEPVALGLGTLNIKELLDTAINNKLIYAAIEHHSKKPFDEMEVSMKYLKDNNLMEVFK